MTQRALPLSARPFAYIPPGSNESITEQEFRQARRSERETLLFLVDPQAPWPERFKERSLAERRLQSLCADIKARLIADYCSSPTDLSTKVAVALARWERPKRTPQEVEREHRLLRTWMYSPPGEERERAKQGLRHMASKRYTAVLRLSLPKMLSGANAFESSDIERMNIGAL